MILLFLLSSSVHLPLNRCVCFLAIMGGRLLRNLYLRVALYVENVNIYRGTTCILFSFAFFKVFVDREPTIGYKNDLHGAD